MHFSAHPAHRHYLPGRGRWRGSFVVDVVSAGVSPYQDRALSLGPFQVEVVRHLVTIQLVCPRPGSVARPAQLATVAYPRRAEWSDRGWLTASWIASDACLALSALGIGDAEANLGAPLRERSCVRHHQVPGVDGDASVDPHRPHRSLPLELIDVSFASLGRAWACGPAPVQCLAGVLAGGAYRGSAAPVTARAGPAVAASRAPLGRRLLLCFGSVSVLISLTGVAA